MTSNNLLEFLALGYHSRMSMKSCLRLGQNSHYMFWSNGMAIWKPFVIFWEVITDLEIPVVAVSLKVPRITEYNADWRDKAIVKLPEGLFKVSGLKSLQNVLSAISKGVPVDIYQKIGHRINDKWLQQLYDANFLWSGFQCNRSRHGNVITPLHFYLSLCFSVQGAFQEIGEIREFQRTNCELSFQTKIRRNFDASVSLLLFPAKFRKLGDEPKRKFAAWTEILLRNFEKGSRNEVSWLKYS